MSYRRRFLRLGGFAILPMFGAVTPLLALPAISDTNGAAGWTAIAVGQSVGAGGSVLVELGWSLTGPQTVAGSSAEQGKRVFAQACLSKLAVLAAVAPVAVLLTISLGPAHLTTAVLSALALCVGGMSANWYFIGLGEPRYIFFSDALPRVLFTLLGVGTLYAHQPLWFFGLCSVLGYLSSFLLGVHLIGRQIPWKSEFNKRAIRSTLRAQRVAVVGRGFSALYIGLPTSLVQAVSPSSVAAFSAAERLIRMGLMILQSVPNAFQRYIGAPGTAGSRQRRIQVTIVSQAIIGVVAASVVAFALPKTVDILFSGTVAVSEPVTIFAASVVLLTCLSRGTGLALVALQDVKWITFSAAGGAAAGVIAIPGLASTGGATGAMAGLVIAELVVFVVQTGRYIRRYASSATETFESESTNLAPSTGASFAAPDS
jgi:O-antigen/teichoic acid export membrane protein